MNLSLLGIFDKNEEVATAICKWLPIPGLDFYRALIFQVVSSCDKYSGITYLLTPWSRVLLEKLTGS
jgi:hypothetical protein